jgi:LmbE family N-acetylglucosaminyl deacetylase
MVKTTHIKKNKLKPRNNPPKKQAVIALKKAAKVQSDKKSSRTGFSTKIYAIVCVLILIVTTSVWAFLGAKIQSGNADQLSNSYLFESSQVFHGGLLPGQHSFLLKWPLFLMVKAFGASATTFNVFTVGTVLVTVLLLAYVFYRIERRPLVFGTLCLALASVLLFVPAVPYPGGILPINMAMLTTRNLEYIVYLTSLTLIIRSPHLKSWRFWLGLGLLMLLIASDKLFLTLSLGGAAIALLIYALGKGWNLVSIASHWLVASITATVGAIAILWLVNAAHITHISSQSGAGPYTLVHGPRDLVLGGIFAILGTLTNFGANPAFDASEIRQIPHIAVHRLLSVSGIGFFINAVVCIIGLIAVWHLIRLSLAHNKRKEVELDRPAQLSVLLIWTTLAAGAAFVVTNHYYVVDARYLTISLFAIFISLATFLRRKNWRPNSIIISGFVLMVGIACGLTFTVKNYRDDQSALSTINSRNATIAQVLSQHTVTTLEGDYWRVLPIKLHSKNSLAVTPLATCTQARDILSSHAWQPDISHKPFAYLLSLDKGLTDYPSCTIDNTIKTFGKPNSSLVVEGSFNNPKELLLFYDHGINQSTPKVVPTPTSTILPITLDELPYTSCPEVTTMNIVAHQDDDLLFMNPDIMRDIQKGYCVRIIYMTAGDAGSNQFYWLSREHGSEAAYDFLDGPSKDIWVQRTVQLTTNEYVSIVNPRGNAKISLIFMHLPDGNVNGGGFKDTHFESLQKLDENKINMIHSVDKQSSYSSQDLVKALASLMNTFGPAVIRTQANYVSKTFPDHSDHMAVGRFVKKAHAQYETQQYDNRISIPLNFYTGYPIHAFPENVTGSDLQQKAQAFSAYARFDGNVCDVLKRCINNPVYGIYLRRQYQNSY